MADPPLWTWVFWLVTLSGTVLGVLSDGDCSEEDLSIQDGHYTLSNGLSVGSLLTYHCPLEYYPSVATRRCQRNGEWDPYPRRSRRLAQCKLVRCPDPMGFQHDLVWPLKDKYYIDDTTNYECYSSYKLSGSPTRVCKPNGKWSGSQPICHSIHNSEHCPDPGIPAGSQRTGDNFRIGDKVSYSCVDGLILVGSKERVCKESGQWTGQEPECYYPYTFDTPDEISGIFSSSLQANLMTDMTGEQEGKRINVGQNGSLHIYVALDVSDNTTTFNVSKQIIIKLIEQISNYEVTPKYDIVVFTTKVIPVGNITNYYTNTAAKLFEVIDQLEKFDYDATRDEAGTDIANAFDHIYQKMSWIKAQNKTKFQKSSHVIIMFTYGESNMRGKPLAKIEQIKHLVQGNKHEADNLDIYMFGVGEGIQKEELNSFATKRDNEKHVFYVQNMDKLHEAFYEMLYENTSVGLCGLHRDYAYSDATHQAQKHPWLVQVKITQALSRAKAECLGSLITPRFILTAAHCFSVEDTEDYITVVLSNFKTAVVKRYIKHEKYNINGKRDKGLYEFYDYSVALIELEEDVKFDENTSPICIPCTKETSRALKLVGDKVTCKTHEGTLLNKDNEEAHFWSSKRTDTHTFVKQHKRKHAMIKVKKTQSLQDQPCFQAAKHVNVTNYEELLTERFLCTGGVEPQTDDATCRGESGGALFLERHKRSIQVGIISWGVSDVCSDVRNHEKSNAKHRDYHISLFEVQPFLRKYVDSLEFIDLE